jgi:uncharacterized RDD family membrane protein YckC
LRKKEIHMTTSQVSVTNVIVTSSKSVGLALVLTFFFGPLGMLYSTVAGALIMLVVTFVSALFTFGLAFVITWPICMIWGGLAAASHNTALERSAAVLGAGAATKG